MTVDREGRVLMFAYGSNMLSERIAARAASARPIATGYVTGRRLLFHKCGGDGSAKADAFYTGCDEDRVWGVVFSLTPEDKLKVDECEGGYGEEMVEVCCDEGPMTAMTYVALPDTIDSTLSPYCWYHGFVTHGAEEHGLPETYRRHLHAIEFIEDSDRGRYEHNWRLIYRRLRGQNP